MAIGGFNPIWWTPEGLKVEPKVGKSINTQESRHSGAEKWQQFFDLVAISSYYYWFIFVVFLLRKLSVKTSFYNKES